MTAFNRPQLPEKTSAVNHDCEAYGCPLPGTFSDSLHGGGTWYCRNHSRSFGAAHDEITTRIRKFQWMLDIARYMGSDLFEKKQAEALRVRANTRFSEAGIDFQLEADKPITTWIRCVCGAFDELVTAGIVKQSASGKTMPANSGEPLRPVALSMPSVKDAQYAD